MVQCLLVVLGCLHQNATYLLFARVCVQCVHAAVLGEIEYGWSDQVLLESEDSWAASPSVPILTCSYLQITAVSGTTMREKLGTKHLKTLQRPRSIFMSV